MKYLLGIDFGGGASKATLIDTDGNIVCESTAEYPTLYPSSGACEQSPQDWIRALKGNIASLLQKSSVSARDILCIALDSATHTFLACDESFKPLRNAVHWTDTRSKKEAAELLSSHGDLIFSKTYHRPSTIWTLPQLVWLKGNEPEIFEKTRYIFFEKDFIRYYLTGVYCTDYIEAEGSMLYNCESGEWDNELCSLASVSTDMLPPIVSPLDVIGEVTQAAASETGLAKGTPVICGTTDTCMEVFASGAVNKGDITVKLATAGRICVITESAHPDTHLVNYSHIEKELWYPGTATKACAASYRWYRDTFGGDYSELDRDAESVPIGCDGLIYHPYLNGELTPYADPSLCASFTGVRASHTKAHFTRAVLEGVAYSLLDCKKYLDSLSIPYNDVATVIGGGAKGGLWRQMIADALGITLRTTESSDSSLGSAMLAGIAAGVFKDPSDAVAHCIREKDTVYPNPDKTKEYARVFERYKRIADALAPIYSEDGI